MLSQEAWQKIQVKGADAYLIECDFLRRYLTGYYSTDGYVILGQGRCVLVVDSRYSEAAENELKGSEIEVVEGAYKTALEVLKGCRVLGVPFDFLTLSKAEKLRGEGFELVDCTDSFKSAMLIKSPEELKLIQKACKIAEDALARLLGTIKEGETEREVAARLEYYMNSLGAEGTSFDTIVAFGEGSSVPHHETGARKLSFGDVVLIDYGCKVQGYCSDCTRTFLFGDDKKHDKFKEVYQHVETAHERVKELTREGMTGREADAIARDYLKEHGLDKFFTHSLGHGVGLQIHEYPNLSPSIGEKLSDGMVFSDEPGVYLKGQFGVRIEDTVTMQNGRVVSLMENGDRDLVIL